MTVSMSWNPGTKYFDHLFQVHAVRIAPGEYHVTDMDIALVTTLGSCVSACVFDPHARVGGMNHFLLPEPLDGTATGIPATSTTYGRPAMEALLGSLQETGARRDRLCARIYGGGRIISGFSNHVGHDNVSFVRAYLATAGIQILSSSVEENHPRRIYFFPRSGKVFLKNLPPIKPVGQQPEPSQARRGPADSVRRAFLELPPSVESPK